MKLMYCEFYSVNFLCSPTSTNQIYATKLMLHLEIYDKALAKIRLEIIPQSV